MTSPDTRAVIISYVPPAANTSNMWLKWEQNHTPHNSPAWVGCWILIGSRLHPVPTGKKIFVNSVQTVHKFKGTAICWQTLPPPTLPENPSLWISALCNRILINLCSGSAFLCFFPPPRYFQRVQISKDSKAPKYLTGLCDSTSPMLVCSYLQALQLCRLSVLLSKPLRLDFWRDQQLPALVDFHGEWRVHTLSEN